MECGGLQGNRFPRPIVKSCYCKKQSEYSIPCSRSKMQQQKNVTWFGKTYINGYPFNALKAFIIHLESVQMLTESV